MAKITGEKPKMWGESIIGFGVFHYKNKTGRGMDWFITGFSPRKQIISLYIMPGLGHFKALLEKLGRYKTGVSCLYIKQLDDVNVEVLKELIAQAVAQLKK